MVLKREGAAAVAGCIGHGKGGDCGGSYREDDLRTDEGGIKDCEH